MSPERILMRSVPTVEWLRDYQKGWLRLDLVAGLTTAAVVVPKAMAYATVAGLPVEVGLYTAFVPMVIYALLGTSRPLSVSTTTTLAILTGTELAIVVPNGDPAALLTASATLAVLVGIMLILAAVLRLGVVASFISEPVLTGFKAGIGLVIILDQVPKLLGIHFDKGGFLQNLLALIHHLPETSLATLAVGVAMLLILVGIERFAPRAPAPLIAVALGIAASALLGASEPRRRDGGPHSPGPAVLHRAEPGSHRAAVARGAWHRADELHRVHRRGAGLRGAGRAAATAESGARGDWRRQYRRRPVQRHARRGRYLPDGG